MRLTAISLSHLRRRKAKVIYLVAGLLIGVALVVSLVSITEAMQTDIQNELDQFGANIVITPRSDSLALSYGGVQLATTAYDVKELHAEDVAKVKAIPYKDRIANAAPKLVGAAEVAGTQALIVGVDFPAELKAKKWWSIDGQEPTSPDQVLLGHEAATKLGAVPGGTLKVNGATYAIAGTLAPTGTQEDSLIFMNLGTVQTILGKPDSLSFIEVSALCKACPIEEIQAQLAAALPNAKVSALAQSVKQRQQTVDQLMSFSWATSVVVFVIAALIVLTTMMGSVNERTREIGIFRATGFRKQHIMRMILFEALLVSAAAGLLGWTIGMAAATWLGPRLAALSGVGWNPLLALFAVGLSVLVGLGSSIYPAVRASNLDPAEALRFI